MKKRLKIYLFRHGQTYYNKNKIFTGFKDSKLTPLGIKQAKVLAKKLKHKKFEVAIRTRLSRSKDTLNEVLKYHPECKRILEDNRMIERSYGNLEGKYHEKVIEKYSNDQFEKWHRDFYKRPPKGESFADVEKRVRKFIKNLIKLMKKENANVAISAHGNSIRLFRKIMEKASAKEACSWEIPYDKYFVYEIVV
ncbi:MAG: phosphoglycerate mutase family protein [Nanoarchaeota archaeon]